ncbi:cytochrome P450 [Xylariaceae sp. FL0016]|nr:cytochrome P450 [Xylariaceae sp. FL0016]
MAAVVYPQLAAAIALTAVFASFARCIYLSFFHPLAKYPGPRWAALTEYWYAIHWSSGSYPYIMQAAHEEYGDLIRTGPNHLSFATIQAHRDIYGYKPLFPKSEWYTGGRPHGIIFERDPTKHSQIRKALSSGFSPRALREDIEPTAEDLSKGLVALLAASDGSQNDNARRIDVGEAFTMFAFDVIGVFTFGKSFDCIETGTLHPLAEMMHTGAYSATLVPLRKRLWFFDKYINWTYRDQDPAKVRSKHVMLLVTALKERIARGADPDPEHQDTINRVLEKQSLTEDVLLNNLVNLLIAGAETVATGLSGALWFLLHNEEALKRLQAEIRGDFVSADEITGESTVKLKYLRAVIDETLRILPPSPFGQSRTSPGASVDGRYIPAGTSVSTDVWCLQHSERYWKAPWSFRPERWLEDNGDDKGAFQPFSEGPRVCLGMGLAYMEMRLVLAKLVWNYDWELDDACRGWWDGLRLEFMWRKPELYVHFRPRSDVSL